MTAPLDPFLVNARIREIERQRDQANVQLVSMAVTNAELARAVETLQAALTQARTDLEVARAAFQPSGAEQPDGAADQSDPIRH